MRGVIAGVLLAPLATAKSAAFPRFPFPLNDHLGPDAVEQQVQAFRAGGRTKIDRQTLLLPAQRRIIRHRLVQTR